MWKSVEYSVAATRGTTEPVELFNLRVENNIPKLVQNVCSGINVSEVKQKIFHQQFFNICRMK